MNINVIIYNGFETLDVFGPVELFGRLPENFQIEFYSVQGGLVRSSQNAQIQTRSFAELDALEGTLLIPGGEGIRNIIHDSQYIRQIKAFAEKSAYIFTVCTGSILFSKTGMLNGKKATSNKRLFQWTALESPDVNWIQKARWVCDGNIYSSSGISAGMDMALGFISDRLDYETAKKQSIEIEYFWHKNKDHDPFCDFYGQKEV